MTYRTYNEWAALGQAVRAGVHAKFYRVDPDTHQGIAVFSEDEIYPTETTESLEHKNWPLVPAAEYKANRQPKKGPPRVLAWQEPDGTWTFWVGTNAKLNKAFKQAGYRWDVKAWRWRSHADVKFPPEKILALIEQGDYTLIREIKPEL